MPLKTKRTLEFKLDAYRFYAQGASAKQAFELACALHNTSPSGCMTDYASSYMSDDIKGWLRKRLPTIQAYLKHHQLANP